MGQGIPPYYKYRAPKIAEAGTIFNVFSYDVVLSRDSKISPPRQQADELRVEPRSRLAVILMIYTPVPPPHKEGNERQTSN